MSGRRKKQKNGEIQEDRLSVLLPTNMPELSTSVAGWKDHATRRVQFKSPEGGFYWHTWVVMVLLLAEVLSVMSRWRGESVLCSWRCWSVTRCCLEWNGERKLACCLMERFLTLCPWACCLCAGEPQVCPISPWWLVSRCSSWVSRAMLMWTRDARHNRYVTWCKYRWYWNELLG